MKLRWTLAASLVFLCMSLDSPLPSLSDSMDKAAIETEKQKMEMEREAQKKRHEMELEAQKDKHAKERQARKQKEELMGEAEKLQREQRKHKEAMARRKRNTKRKWHARKGNIGRKWDKADRVIDSERSQIIAFTSPLLRRSVRSQVYQQGQFPVPHPGLRY